MKVEELAAKLGVSKQTIYNKLKALDITLVKDPNDKRSYILSPEQASLLSQQIRQKQKTDIKEEEPVELLLLKNEIAHLQELNRILSQELDYVKALLAEEKKRRFPFGFLPKSR